MVLTGVHLLQINIIPEVNSLVCSEQVNVDIIPMMNTVTMVKMPPVSILPQKPKFYFVRVSRTDLEPDP